jgi:hypothetical protein
VARTHILRVPLPCLGQRVGLPIRVSTFNALGWSIIAQVEGKAPSLAKLAEDDKALLLFLREQVSALLKTDPTFARKFAERKRKDGSGSFLGCSNYPECRYTKNMPGAARGTRARSTARLD